MWEALGAIVLFCAALAGWSRIMWHLGGTSMREQLRLEQAERRSLRRIEARQQAYTGRHQLAPWPGPEPAEQLATTGELRALAETGDLAEIRRHNAAFHRLFAFKSWVRAA